MSVHSCGDGSTERSCPSARTAETRPLTAEDRERLETRAQILKALAHPSRIFIMERLNLRPHCVNELTGLIGADTSTVSKHLSVLKNSGLVEIRKEGTTVYYSLTCPCVITLLDCIEGVIERNLEKQLAYFSKESP